MKWIIFFFFWVNKWIIYVANFHQENNNNTCNSQFTLHNWKEQKIVRLQKAQQHILIKFSLTQ